MDISTIIVLSVSAAVFLWALGYTCYAIGFYLGERVGAQNTRDIYALNTGQLRRQK